MTPFEAQPLPVAADASALDIESAAEGGGHVGNQRLRPLAPHGLPLAHSLSPAPLPEQESPGDDAADRALEPTDAAALPLLAGGGDEPAPRRHRRPRRRELHCPLHPEQRIFSVSPKHHLYVTDVGQLMLRGLSKRRADELLAAYRRVLPLTDEWIECFWCDDCGSTSWWHVKRHDRHEYTLSTVPRELWEQATGVIRAEGNPTVSQFTRRQARACGVQGLRQYRFL